LNRISDIGPLPEAPVLIFTPTTINRAHDTFLKPCWERRGEIILKHDQSVRQLWTEGKPVSDAYQFGLQYAIDQEIPWVLCYEDDVFPPLNIIETLMDAKNPAIYCGRIPLRPASTKLGAIKWTPWVGYWDSRLSDFYSYRELTEAELRQKTVKAHLPANPFLFPTKLLQAAGIRFRGKRSWDSCFARDCYLAGVPIHCVTRLKSKHYCIETQTIIGDE